MNDKADFLSECLTHGKTQIFVNTQVEGVLVPPHLMTGLVILNISYLFVPRDLTLDSWGVFETLSFGGQEFRVAVPWDAIIQIVGQKTMRSFTPELAPAAAGDFVPMLKQILDDAAEPEPKTGLEKAAKRWGGAELVNGGCEVSEPTGKLSVVY